MLSAKEFYHVGFCITIVILEYIIIKCVAYFFPCVAYFSENPQQLLQYRLLSSLTPDSMYNL